MSMGDECDATEDSDKEVDSLRCDRYRGFVQVSSSLEQMEKRSVSDSAASDSSRGQNSTRTSSSTASSTSEMIQQPDFRLMRDMPSSVSLLYDQANASINRTTNEERKLIYDGYAAGVPALEPYAEMLTPDLESGISVLSVAASAGYCELVHVLLNCMRMGPDDRGPKGDCTPLMEAASAGHTDIVRCLVEHGADVNAHSSVGALGNTPLIYACAAGHDEAVEILLDAGADVDLCNDNGQTPLMEAAAAGHIGIAKLLVDRGARVNYVSSDLKVGLETPLTLACYKGHADMVKFLLKVGGENNCSGRDEELHTALMEASMDGHVEVAKLLLEAGAQVNLAADTFESPLTLAACGGHVELAKLYLSNGATLEEFNEEGYTPLMEASREGYLGVVRLLVEHGADVNMLSRRGESTLALAAGANFKNIVAYLLSKGADIERGASTALMEAAQEGNYETLNYLLESGANVHTATSQGDTAMSYAAQSGQTKICEVLLAAGASLEHQGEMGRTALMKAAGAGQRETVEFLLRKGANPNLPTFDNDQTALSVACGNGQLAIVDLLLQNGADPKVKLKDGSSCLLEAAKGGHTRVVQYLLDWPESSGTAVQYNSCCVIPPSTMVHANVPSICDAETVTADSTVYAPVVTDGSLMTSSAEAVQAILANGACSTTVMAANTFTRGLPLVVTPLSDYVASAPTGSLPSVNLPNLAVTSDGSIYYPTIPQMDGKKVVRKHCTTRPASGDDSTTNDLKLLHETLKPQSQELVAHFGEQSPTMDDGESGCKSVKSRRAELDADDKELEQLKKTQKVYENLKNVAATHKSCANSTAPLYDRDYSCFSAGSVAPECKHLYETPCYRQVVIDPANANVAVTSVTDVAAVHKMELYAAAVDGQTDGETCHSSQFQVLHPHVNVVLPVPHSCAGQQSLPCNFVVSREENVCFSPAVSVAMVSVTASEAAAIYRNSSCYGYSGNVMPLEGVTAAAGVIPTNYAVANGEKLYIPVHLAQQDINSATFHGFAAGTIPTLGNLSQGVIPIQARPAGAMVAVPTVAVNSVNAMPLLTSKATATSLVTNTITTKTAMSAQTTTTEADNKSTQTPFICVPRRPSDDSGKNVDSAAVAKPNIPPRPLAQDLELQTDTNHDTALSFAAAGGHEELVTFLLQRGANIEHRDKKGYTPLMVAASGGHQKVVELLIAHGANVEAQSERTKETALSIACQMGRREVVEILLKHNANKEHRNLSDYTPMCLAAAGGCTDVIELLLQHGAEINSRSGSKLGISPLMLAAMNGNAATVKFLIDRGADINAQIETNRNTALTLACFQGKPEVVRILVEHRANVEHRAKTGFTPLMEAASGGFVEVGHVLLQAGADPNCTPVPSSRDTCLTLAADKGHNSFVDLLLQYTNQVDCRTKKGYTALWLAAHGGHQECVLSLIEAGADVDMPDNRRITPLMAAFRKGHIEVVKCLVDHVTQFPSDQDLARYQTSITDNEVKQKCETAVEIIKTAKDRQAQMANKVAAGLLMEIEQEQQIAETRRQARLRKKEKNRQKRLKKKAAAAAQQQQQPHQEETNDDEDESKVVLTRTESNDSLSVQNVEAKSDSEEHSNEETPPVFVKDSRQTANSSLSSSRVSSYSISPERKSCPTTTTTTTATTSNVVMADMHVEEEVDESRPEPKYADAHSEDAASKSSDADFIPVVSHDSRIRSGQVFERKIRRRRLRRPRLNEPVAQAKTQTLQKNVRHSSTTISTSLSNSTGASSRQMPPTSVSTLCSRSFGNKNTEPTNHSKSGHFGRDESVLPCDGGSESTRSSTRWKTVRQSRSREETQDSNSGGALTWREVRRQPHKLFVSAHAIARVIGRGGQNINAIRESSGAHIEVEKQQRGQADRLVTIKGCSEAIKQAVYMINGLINEPESHVNTIINKVRSKDRKALESFAHPKPSVSNSSASNSSSARSSTKADKGAGAFPEVSLWVPTTTIPASSTTPTKAAISVSTPPSATSAAFAHNNAWNPKPSAQSPKMNYASVVASKLSMSPTLAGPTLKMENDGSIFIEQSSTPGYRDKAKRFTSVADAQWCYGDRGDLLSGLKTADMSKTRVSSNEWDGGTAEQTDDLSMAKSGAEPVTLSIVSDGSMAGYAYSTSVNYPSGPISSVSQKSAASYPNIIDVDNGRHSAGGNSITLSNQGFCSPSAVQRPASAAASIESNAAMLAGRLTQAEHGVNSSDFANDTLLLHEANYPMPIGSERRLKSAAIAASSANAENKSGAIYVQNQSTLSSVESTPSSLMNELFLNHCDRSWGVDRPTENGCGDVEKPDWSAPFGGRRFSTEWSSSMASFDSNISSRSFAYDYPSSNNAVPPIDTVDPLHHQSAFYGSGSLQQQQQQSVHQPVPPPPVSASALIHPPYFSPNIPPPPVIPPRIKFVSPGYINGGGYPGETLPPPSARNLPIAYGYCPPPMLPSRPLSDGWNSTAGRRIGHPRPNSGEWKISNGSSVAPHCPPVPPLPHAQHPPPPPPPPTGGGWGGWNSLSM